MGLKQNIGLAIEESDRQQQAIPFMTLVELDDYLTKMVQKEFGRKDILVTVDIDAEQVLLGREEDFESEEDGDIIEENEPDGNEPDDIMEEAEEPQEAEFQVVS